MKMLSLPNHAVIALASDMDILSVNIELVVVDIAVSLHTLGTMDGGLAVMVM